MSCLQQTLEALDPSVLAILDISNTARCCIYCRAQHEKTNASYDKPATGRPQRDLQCDEDLLFQCASLFKVFIAACLILIIDKLSSDPGTTARYRKLEGAWDRPFTDVFNELVGVQDQMRPLPGDPSVKQLLLHYNGVYDINHILLGPDGTPLQCLHDVIDRISRYANDTRQQPAEGENQIIYSNANYILLALLVDKASGSLNEFLKEYIFEPFGMKRTFLCLEDLLHSRSTESQRQPHVVSSDGRRRIFRPTTILGLSDIVEIAWLGPYTSAADLGRFFEGLLSAKDGIAIGRFDKAVFESLGRGRSFIDKQAGYTPCGLYTSLNSTGPGSHSLNRMISPKSGANTHILGKTSGGEEISAFYLAGSATGWASTVYFLPFKRTFVIVLTNSSSPLDASDLISRLYLQEIFDLRPPKAISWDVSNLVSSRSAMTSAERYIALARQIFDENAIKVKELEELDAQPDTPTSSCPDLPGKYFCSRNGQYLDITDWKGEDNDKPEGVLRIVIRSGPKSSQKLRFAKKGEKFRICSPGTSSVLAIDCFGAWKNLEFEVERDGGGVKSLLRRGEHLDDIFIRVKS
jgi:CubicO group peptidase (beta-lactamase class C family)